MATEVVWERRLTRVLRRHHLRFDGAFEPAWRSAVDILVILIVCTSVVVSRAFVFLRTAML